ncbi:MAG: type secretion system, GspF-like protein [Rhodocyclaceae bacterium]|nr:type secretion system, GspF-like protein [Rhodocyclaceae bacterium]
MRYEVKAIKGAGVASLSIEAASDADAALRAQGMGYKVLTVRPAAALVRIRFGRRATFPLVLFTQELLALLGAGLPLLEAMETLVEKEHRPEARKVLEGVIRILTEGQTLSAALEQYPAVFPALYVATVRASERTGDLPEALGRYVAYQSQVEAIKKKIISSAIYPVLLMVVGGLVVIFLMGYVVPRFAGVYESMGSNLPFFSRVLLAWGELLNAHALAMSVAVLGALAGLAYAVLHPGFKRWFGTRLWAIPWVGERMRVYQLARFYRTVGMLLSGGTPVVNALDMVSGLLQPTLRGQLQRAVKEIREGYALSRAMDGNGLTTPVASRMLRVGEGTGQMGEMMERIAVFHEEEMARWVDWFTRLFEPILMAVIGLVIGAIVVLMYMPIFELAGSIR